jgi:hypothetical protein
VKAAKISLRGDSLETFSLPSLLLLSFTYYLTNVTVPWVILPISRPCASPSLLCIAPTPYLPHSLHISCHFGYHPFSKVCMAYSWFGYENECIVMSICDTVGIWSYEPFTSKRRATWACNSGTSIWCCVKFIHWLRLRNVLSSII